MRRYSAVLLLACLCSSAFAQKWVSAYQTGLNNLKSGDFASARGAFKVASGERPGDMAGATALPGPITERKTWRNGAAYSPLFLAAYSGYRLATSTASADAELLRSVASEFEALHAAGQGSKESFQFLIATYSTLGDNESKLKVEEQLSAHAPRFRVDLEGVERLNVPAATTPAPAVLPKVVTRPAGQAPVFDDRKEVAAGGFQAGTSSEATRTVASREHPMTLIVQMAGAAQPAVPVAPGVQPNPTAEVDTKPAAELKPVEIPKVAETTPKAEPAPAPAPAPRKVRPAGAPDMVVAKPEQRVPTGQVQAAVASNLVLASAVAPTTGVTHPNPMPAGGTVSIVPNKFALIVGTSDSKMTQEPIPFASDDAQQLSQALVNNAGYAAENVDLVLNATAQQIYASAQALADRVPEGGTVFIYFTGPGVNVDGKDYLAGIDTEVSTDLTSMLPKAELYKLFMAKGARIYAFYQVNRQTVYGRYFGAEVPMVGSIAQIQATLPNGQVLGVVKNGKTVGLFTDALVTVLTDLRSNHIPILEFGWQVFNKIRRGDTGSTGGGSRQIPTLPVLTNMASDSRF